MQAARTIGRAFALGTMIAAAASDARAQQAPSPPPAQSSVPPPAQSSVPPPAQSSVPPPAQSSVLLTPSASARPALSSALPWQVSQAWLVSNLQLRAPWLSGEPAGTGSASPWIQSAPLRLSLQSPIFPMAGGFANCVSREEAAGNTVNGFAVQRFASLQLAPGLTVHGFTSGGCPVDGAIGGGVTYVVPLRPTLALVASAGAYAAPNHPSSSRVSTDARIDLTKSLDSGRTLSVGVGRRGVSIGGSW